MSTAPSRNSRRARRHWYHLVVVGLVCGAIAGPDESVMAQRTAHYLFHADLPTGEIGRIQSLRRPELHGFFQPVRIAVPSGATVAVADGGSFAERRVDATLVGLQVGQVYRLHVGDIPNQAGADVYPTVELLDRLHPPAGKETRYPIPIEITAEDLAHVVKGKYVLRVIYVEDPRTAIAARDVAEQPYFEVLPTEDPLVVAGELGRPVAILRMGTVTPGAEGFASEFLFGSPPMVHYAEWPEVAQNLPQGTSIRGRRNANPDAAETDPREDPSWGRQ